MRQLRAKTILTVVTGLPFLQNLSTKGKVRPRPASKRSGIVSDFGDRGSNCGSDALMSSIVQREEVP